VFDESFLDIGGPRLTQGLAGAVVALVSLLIVAICLPVLLIAILLGAASGATSAAPALLASGLLAPLTVGPIPQSATTPTRPAPHDSPTESAPAPGDVAIDLARRYLGVRYVFGGTNPAVGLDCSGLVQLVYRQLGIVLPRTAQQQYNATARLTRNQLQPGDLVFFARTYADPNDWITHVGIYIGNGQQINAPDEGQVVSIQPVFTGFWGAHFAGGGRVATH
jgi:cell wall-associated NlpC family hydrolase